MLEFKFDTQLLIDAKNLDEDEVWDYIVKNIPGDCLLAIADEDVMKIHYHTNTPWKVLKYGTPRKRTQRIKQSRCQNDIGFLLF